MMASASAPALAQDNPVPIHIPAQPLSEALLKLAEQTQLQVFFSPSLVQGLSTTPIQGRMRPEEALRSLPRPVIGRVADQALWLDLRCLEAADQPAFDAQLPDLQRALNAA